MLDGVTAPYSIEAEQAILGALLIQNEVLDKLGWMQPEHFYDPVHGRIFDAIKARIADGHLAAPLTMAPFLRNDPGLADLGGADYLGRLAGAAVSVKAAPHYARMVRELHARRLAVNACEEGISLASNQAGDLGAALARIEEHCALIRETIHQRGLSVTMADAALAAMDRMDNPAQSIPTGLAALDRFLGGLFPSDLTIIGARPSMGKSALAVEMARRIARRDRPVVFWSREMSKEDLALRMIAADVRERGFEVPYSTARRGKVSPQEAQLMAEAAARVGELPVHIIEPRVASLGEGLHEIKKIAKRRPGLTVIVDYLQLVRGAEHESENVRVSRISNEMKTLANEINGPVVCLSQLSRKVEERPDHRPQLSDLRDSGSIEQDADNVMFLYRGEYYLERAKPPEESAKFHEWSAAMEQARGIMEVHVSKARHGPVGVVEMGFDPATNSFWDRT